MQTIIDGCREGWVEDERWIVRWREGRMHRRKEGKRQEEK